MMRIKAIIVLGAAGASFLLMPIAAAQADTAAISGQYSRAQAAAVVQKCAEDNGLSLPPVDANTPDGTVPVNDVTPEQRTAMAVCVRSAMKNQNAGAQ